MNGHAGFTRTTDMIADHSLFLVFARRRRLPVLERLLSFHRPADPCQHQMSPGNQGGRFGPARSAGQAPEALPPGTVVLGCCHPGALIGRAPQPGIASRGGVAALVFTGGAVVLPRLNCSIRGFNMPASPVSFAVQPIHWQFRPPSAASARDLTHFHGRG